MKTFDKGYRLLDAMYRDGYFPDFLVDRVKEPIQDVIVFLETGARDEKQIQYKLDNMTLAINDMQEAFEENDSELETEARESIAETVSYILEWFGIDIDIEDAIREREW